jgi:membrane-bound metal-dependent hydrolase YbcI (DUF457 family)
MLKRNHFLWTLGISPWLFYYLNLNLELIFTLSLLTAFLSSLPDIDLKIVKYFKKLNYRSFFLTYPIYILVKLIFKHRTITHSLFIPISLLLLNKFIITNYYLSLFLFSLSFALILHVFEDCMTIAGVKIFWPLKYNLRLASFRTASNFHNSILHILGIIILLTFPFYYFL